MSGPITDGELLEYLCGHADALDAWADQSQSGGWSTHQVGLNRAAANECRRMAARLAARMRQ